MSVEDAKRVRKRYENKYGFHIFRGERVVIKILQVAVMDVTSSRSKSNYKVFDISFSFEIKTGRNKGVKDIYTMDGVSELILDISCFNSI